MWNKTFDSSTAAYSNHLPGENLTTVNSDHRTTFNQGTVLARLFTRDFIGSGVEMNKPWMCMAERIRHWTPKHAEY